MKVYRWRRGTPPPILNFGTRWRGVVNFTTPPLYPLGKKHRYPLNRMPFQRF
jgi:hypothetical protein